MTRPTETPCRRARLAGYFRERLLVIGLALLAWWAACWIGADAWFERQTDAAYRAETEKAERFVATAAQGYERIVSVRLGMPRILARDPAIRRFFARIGPVAPGAELPDAERKRRWTDDPAFAALNRRLAQDAADLGLGALGLFDTRGNTFALGTTPGEKNWIGVNYADRDYFPAILAGRSGYRVIFGKQFGVPGIAFYAPVIDGRRVRGAVIGRVDLAPFGNWLAPADAFLTDRNGVVVLASDNALVGNAAADAPVRRLDAAARQVAYRHADLGLLDIAPWGDARYPELRRVAGRGMPVIHRAIAVATGDEPVVNVLWPFPQRVEFVALRNIAALGLGAGGTALALFALAVVARRREQRQHRIDSARREQEFRSLAESSPDAIVRYDCGHRIRYLNSRLVRELGLARAEDAIGKRPSEIWPDGRYAAIDAVAARAIETGRAESFELVAPVADGKFRISQIRVVPERDADGEIVGTVVFGWEITEIKATEAAVRKLNARLTAILDALPDLLFEVDRAGTYLDIRAPDPSLLAAPKEELLGRTIAEMLPPAAAEVAMATLREADSCGKSYGNILHLDLPGETRWFEISAAKKPAATAAETTFIMLSRDVTERKRYEAAREAALAEARRLAKLHGEFVALMSHELRTPLNAILGHAQMLQGVGDRPCAAAARDIRLGGEHLLAMVDDILDLMRAEAGQLTLEPDDIALAPFLRDIGAAAERLARDKLLAYVCVPAGPLPAVVRVDAKRLRAVLLKLLDNACKFTERGRIALEVEAVAPGRLRFAVADTGPGIAAERIAGLFQPFDPAGELLRRHSGGGLGLAVCRRLTRLMGGEIAVDSRPGAGSTFSFEIDAPTSTEAEANSSIAADAAVADAPSAAELAPPPHELQNLHRLARQGNMSDIRREAERIAALDPRYHPFAARLRQLAAAYRSKALLAFVEAHLAAHDASTTE